MFCPALSFLAYWSVAVTLVAYGSAALDLLACGSVCLGVTGQIADVSYQKKHLL